MKLLDEELLNILKNIRKQTTRLEFEAMGVDAISYTEIKDHLSNCAQKLESVSFKIGD